MDIIALRQKMIEKKKTNKELSFELGISRSAIQRKLSGSAQFTQGEIKTLIKVLDLTPDVVMSIFFTDKVS